MDDVTRLLSDLVSIPSVNPMGRMVAPSQSGESRLTAFLESWMHARGIPSRRQPVSPGRDNLLARFDSPAGTRRRVLLFDAHQDTVPTDGMTIDPFTPRIEGRRLYGRGSCDVKGSLAAMLWALQRLHRERPTAAASVILACTVDEEFTHTGSSALAAFPHQAGLAVVAEPTSLELVACHKGAIRWRIRTRGVACHSSTPERGINAIYRMARVVETLEQYANELAASPPDPILGPPTLSVGRIEGGQSVNIVPDWCEIEIDRRVIPGEHPQSCLEEVGRRLAGRFAGAEWIEMGAPWVNMPALSARLELWEEPLKEAVRSVTGRTPQVLGVPFGTDAGPLGASGLPCVVLGPGDIAQAHTRDEWIDLDQVDQAAEIYFQIALRLG